jgi:hypothetical protein
MSGEAITLEGTVLQEHRGDVFDVEVRIGETVRRVLARRERAERGEPLEDLAEEHHVTRRAIELVVQGLRWQHVSGPCRASTARAA